MDKVGRNDPCPCGSGKKYKNCCYGKKEAKKTYTPEGKRKFTAKVISSGGQGGIFQNIGPPMPTSAEPFESLKFKKTKQDYKQESQPTQEKEQRATELEKPSVVQGEPEQPPDTFEMTEENYEK